MAKIFGGTVSNKVESPRLSAKQEDGDRAKFEANLSKGMISTVDPTLISEDALTIAKNVRIRPHGGIKRRNGTVLFTPEKPNDLKILELAYFKKNNRSEYTLRFTKSSIHKRGVSSWTLLTGALTGSDSDRFDVVSVFDNLVFTNHGADKIQIIDPTVSSYAPLGNAPKYKYITPFFNRVIGGYYNEPGTENPDLVGWSADGVIAEWNSLTNLSAGSTPLIENPSDVADFITGMFGFSSVMIILKEHSIWLATKQPSATNPFNFFVAVPGLGCDAPYSVAVIPGGLIYADVNSHGIYIYVPGQAPEPISQGVFREIFANVNDPSTLFASYDVTNSEYSLTVTPAGSDTTKIWIYNLKTRTFEYDERRNVSCISDVQGIATALTIDTLPGPSIDALTWSTIDSIGVFSIGNAARLYGLNNGDIQKDDLAALTDAGSAYETDMTSKVFGFSIEELGANKFIFSVDIEAAGSIAFSYSKDKGRTWKLAKVVTFTTIDIGENRVISFKKLITMRNVVWKLTSSDGIYTVHSYKVNAIKSNDASTRDKI